MHRRQVIQSLGLISSHALFPSVLTHFLSSCSQPVSTGYEPRFFSDEELDLVVKISDIILPATKTLSASQVRTHFFLDEVFEKCLTPDQQQLIKSGLKKLLPVWEGSDDKEELLARIDGEAFSGSPDHAYFKVIKQYTLIGFFTSQEGTTKASNYVKFPGNYQGEIPADQHTLNYGKTTLRFYL